MGQTRGRGDVSDEQWALIEPLLPRQKRGGKWNDHRTTFNGMLWVLRTGAPWRDLPERYGKWASVYHRFNRWRQDGTIERVLKALRILNAELPMIPLYRRQHNWVMKPTVEVVQWPNDVLELRWVTMR